MNIGRTKQVTEMDRIECLRLILEAEQGRSVTYEEALEVGESLICFFEVLADDSHIEQEHVLQVVVQLRE